MFRPEAVAALTRFLENRASAHRSIAALALGLAGDPPAAAALVPLLQDPEPFTRLCAYESLRHLTGQDHFADWLRGPAEERAAAAERYAQWTTEHP